MKKLLFLICLYAATAIASEPNSYHNKLNCCKITKSSINDYEPREFQLSNNLLRKTGQQPIYRGTKIIVKGILLDQDCVPISDAKIYLWQVGSDGKYPYVPLRTRINKKMLNLGSQSSFTGSGTATTNNKGEFYFVTIYPGKIGHKTAIVNSGELGSRSDGAKPICNRRATSNDVTNFSSIDYNVNIRVEHLYLGQLQTKLYLSNSMVDLESCGEVSHVLANLSNDIRTYEFKVVMPGRTFKRY